jgi:peptidoglycan biosynthesis protein MviN/MurJ (putative lipid II flippase)
MGGLQWVLCRALAARQRQRAMLCSFGVTAVVMVVLDLVVIGRFGTIGAAAASSAAVAVGLLVAVMFLARDVPTAELVPRWHDFVSLLLAARGLLSRVG